MWPFNKSKKTTDYSNLPEEVQRYYNAEERDRSGASWLLAAGTLIATVVIAVGLFFGGRWLVTSIFGNNDPVVTTTPTSETTSTSSTNSNEANNQTEAEDTEPAPQPEPADTEDEARTSGVDSDQTDLSPRSQTPSTGSSSDSLPNTGPTGPLL